MEKKKLEELLQKEINKNLATKLFLEELAHEAKTPLGAIQGFLELIFDKNTKEKDKKEYELIIQDSAKRLGTIIDEYSRMILLDKNTRTKTYERFSVKKMLEEEKTIFSTRAKNKSLDIKIENDDDLIIFSDRLKVKQITSNIIKNALKFTDEGGINISYSSTKTNIFISVNDSGHGINKNDQKKIFEKYSQVNTVKKTKGGSGLGLYISKKLAIELGGDIFVESNYQRGSTFIIKLPKQKQKDILIVEPEYNSRKIIEIYLNKYNEKTYFRDSCEKGIKELERKDFDLIILGLDKEINSMNYLDEIVTKGNSRKIPLILCSNKKINYENDEFRKYGEVLEKPCTRKLFEEKILPYINN